MFEGKNNCCKKLELLNSCYLLGPTGPRGTSDTLEIRNTITGDVGTEAKVIDTTGAPHHVLDFVIPQGKEGTPGANLNILGHYDTLDDLKKDHPTGQKYDAYLVGKDLYIWTDTGTSWENVGPIEGPQGKKGDKGDKGDIGPTGPKGDTSYPIVSYLVTFNPGTSEDGVEILSGDKLPIDRKEIDITNLLTLDKENKTIKFNRIGYYKVVFVASAYTQATDIEFNPHRDFVSLGFGTSSDIIHIGASEWVYDETATQIIGQGVIVVDNTDSVYSLMNVGKYTIYLNTPDILDINSHSYFTNSLLTIMVEYLGKQTSE